MADLLDFSRSKESKLERRKQSINVSIENVLSMVQQQFLKQKVKLTTHLDPALPDCFIDERRIKQVLLNLIMNGAQAIVEEGEVIISSRLFGFIKIGNIIFSIHSFKSRIREIKCFRITFTSKFIDDRTSRIP